MKIIRCKFFLIFVLGCCFFVAVTLTYAGENSKGTNSEVVISMDIREKPLRVVLQDISELTGYQIKVSDDLLDIPISGIFTEATITNFLGRILKGRNIFILEDKLKKMITVRATLIKDEKLTAISMRNNPNLSGETLSFNHLRQLQGSLNKIFENNNQKIESSPGISYQEMIETRRNLDQKINSDDGKIEVKSYPEMTYKNLVDTRNELDSMMSRKNNSVKDAAGGLYREIINVQNSLDKMILADENTVESSPGVFYRTLAASQLKLDNQLAAHN